MELEDVKQKAEAETSMAENSAKKPSTGISIVSGAFTIGKQAGRNEDAFFVSQRAFGVADGVSGWQDFGFSSEEFSR